jgi:hypothetical protein
MAKGGSEFSSGGQVMPEDAPVNIGALLGLPFTAGQRVLGIQTKLHRWAVADPGRRFDDLYNLVADPAFLVTAWHRVRGNTGARSAGVDKRTVAAIERSAGGAVGFLEGLRALGERGDMVRVIQTDNDDDQEVRARHSPRVRAGRPGRHPDAVALLLIWRSSSRSMSPYVSSSLSRRERRRSAIPVPGRGTG